MNDVGGPTNWARLPSRLRQLAEVLLIFWTGLLAYFAVRFAQVILEDPLHSPWIRGPVFLLCVCVSLGSILWAFQQVRRIRDTGRFLETGAERLIKRELCISKLGSDRPFSPQASFWLVLGVLSLALLSIALLAVAFAVSLDRSYDLVQIPLFLLAATLLFHLLILPLKGLQRKVVKGSFLPLGEECAELCERYWKPQEIELACLSILTASIWSCWPIKRLVLHRTGSGADVDQWLLWVVAAIWWVGALRRLWRVFHPVAIQSPQTQRFDGPTRPEVRNS